MLCLLQNSSRSDFVDGAADDRVESETVFFVVIVLSINAGVGWVACSVVCFSPM